MTIGMIPPNLYQLQVQEESWLLFASHVLPRHLRTTNTLTLLYSTFRKRAGAYQCCAVLRKVLHSCRDPLPPQLEDWGSSSTVLLKSLQHAWNRSIRATSYSPPPEHGEGKNLQKKAKRLLLKCYAAIIRREIILPKHYWSVSFCEKKRAQGL